MFEHRKQPLLSKREFLIRQLVYIFVALGIILGSIFMGLLGYHYLENLPWIDSLLNAAMILGGMGPVNELHTESGKLFASFYALYSGIIFLVVVGVIFVPLYHRFLHRFHLELEEWQQPTTTPANTDEATFQQALADATLVALQRRCRGLDAQGRLQ